MAETRTSKWYWNGKNYSSKAAMIAAKSGAGDTSATTTGLGSWASPAYGGASAVHAAEPSYAQKFGDSIRDKQISYGIGSDANRSMQQNYELAAYGTGGRSAFEAAGGWSGSVADPDATKNSWFNAENMEAFGHATKGLGALASGWAALKNLTLTRQAMDDQNRQWEQNYQTQRGVTNNMIANQNAWKQAQGRTDFGAYVGGKPPGSNYVG